MFMNVNGGATLDVNVRSLYGGVALVRNNVHTRGSIMKIHTSSVVFVVVMATSIQMIIAPGYNNNMYKSSTNGGQKVSQTRYVQHPEYKINGGKGYGSDTKNNISPIVRSIEFQNYMYARTLHQEGMVPKRKPEVSRLKAFRITLFNEGVKTYILDKFTSCQNISAEIATNLGLSMSSPLEFFLKEACSFALFCAVKPWTEAVGKVIFGEDYMRRD